MVGRIVGFTGTQHGVTPAQERALEWLLDERRPSRVHHGDCVGGDATIDRLAATRGIRRTAHPPVNASRRAWCRADVVLPAREYLDRDRDVVDVSHELWVVPRGFREERRSGTWYTFRYAAKLGRPITVVWPDGTVEDVPPGFKLLTSR